MPGVRRPPTKRSSRPSRVRSSALTVAWLVDYFFFSSRRRHTRCLSDWSSDVCSSDLESLAGRGLEPCPRTTRPIYSERFFAPVPVMTARSRLACSEKRRSENRRSRTATQTGKSTARTPQRPRRIQPPGPRPPRGRRRASRVRASAVTPSSRRSARAAWARSTWPATQCPVIVTEHVPGHDLKKVILSRAPLTGGDAIGIVQQIAAALDYAHRRGIVHRDIKPANVLITDQGRVKITDFGVARLPGSDLTRSDQFVGSPGFMSPEQLKGAPVDGRADLFSLGVIFYQLL